MIELAVIIVSFGALFLASIADLKTSEIPEQLSLGLIAFILTVALLNTAYSWELIHLASAVMWGVIALAIGYVLFALGQWGGGDVKILAGVGCLLGYLDSLDYAWPNSTFIEYEIPPLLTYFIDMAFAATPYVIVYTIILGIMNPVAFTRFRQKMLQGKTIAIFVISTAPAFLAWEMGFDRLGTLYLLVPLMVVASVYMKTVESVVLTKNVKVSQLKEWDIPADDVVADGEKIASKRNIEGITPEQLERIRELAAQGRIPDELRIKWGVKFAPILLVSLILTLYVGNILDLVFKSLA